MGSLANNSGLAAPGRRRFVQGLAALGSAAAAGLLSPGRSLAQAGIGELSGERFALSIDRQAVNVTGRPRLAYAVNGLTPGPLLRWREGDAVTLNVVNRLDEPTSIHWHGIRLPSDMDGTPGLSFAGIPPRGAFAYRFPVVQRGTYWYHSHSGGQEQAGMYAPIVIEPAPREKGGERYKVARDYVVMLSDQHPMAPDAILRKLKQEPGYFNNRKRTLPGLMRDLSAAKTTEERQAIQAKARNGERALTYGTGGSETHWALEDMMAAVEGGTRCYIVSTATEEITWL